MNTSVEKLEGNRVRITVTHSAAEVDAAIKDAYALISRKVKIQGFRPGKAPRTVIDTHVGRDSVLAEALESLVEGSYPLAIEEHRLRPMEAPDTGELDQLDEGADYTYTAEVDVKPEMAVESLEGIKAEIESMQTTDAEVEQQIEYLRDRYATLEPVEDRGVAADDFILVSFTGAVDGKPADDLTVDKYMYEMGKGIMPEDFEKGLLGAKAGEPVHVEFDVPASVANPEYAGKKAAFEVEIHEIKRKKAPEADDAFAGNVGGFETIQELRDDIRKHLQDGKMNARLQMVERAALDAVGERLTGEVPAQLIQTRTREMAQEFFENLEKRGMTPDEYAQASSTELDQVYRDIEAEAGLRVRDEMALEAIFRQAGLEYTDEDINGEILAIAGTQKEPVEKVRERLVRNGAIAFVRERLMHRRASAWLVANAEIVEREPGTAEETAVAEKPAKKAAAKKTAKKPSKKAAEAADDAAGPQADESAE